MIIHEPKGAILTSPSSRTARFSHSGLLVAVLLLVITMPRHAHGQESVTRSPTLSAGVLAGPTSGLTFKALFDDPRPGEPGRGIDLNTSFNGQGFFQLSGHSLMESHLPDTPLRLFLGAGMAAELDDGTLSWGLSTTIGGYFQRGPYDILFQLIPRLMVTPEREGTFGAAVGLRYRF